MILREAQQVYVPEINLSDVLEYIHGLDRAKKIEAVKTVKSTYHLGLKDSKDLIELGWSFLDFVKYVDFPVEGCDFTTAPYYREEDYDGLRDEYDELPW